MKWILYTLCAIALIVLPGAAPVGSGEGEHGWCVYRNALGQLVLVHLPPRTEESDDRINPGSAYTVRPLKSAPEAIATHGTRVAMIFPLTMVDEQPLRRVLGGRAVAYPSGAGWVFDPPSHLNASPSLPGAGTLHGFIAPNGVPHALMETDNDWSLLRLDNDGWETTDLPEQSMQDRMLVAWNETVLLLTRSEDGATTAAALDDKGWNAIDLAGLDRVWDAPFVIGHKNELVVGSIAINGSLEIHALRSSDLLVHSITDPPEEMGALILDGSDALILISRSPASREQMSTIRMIEIDLNSGRVLHDGEPIQRAILGDAIRSLLFLFFAMGSLVVLILVRPSIRNGFVLPDGYAIAEPTRRFAAMLIDLALLSVLIAPMFDVGILELFTGNVLVRADNGWLAFPAMLGAGMILSTISESIWGVTLGKLVVRVRLVQARIGDPRVLPVHRALTRNLIKWFLPPIPMLCVLDPGFRHRADLAVNAAAVVRAPDPKSTNKADDQSDPE